MTVLASLYRTIDFIFRAFSTGRHRWCGVFYAGMVLSGYHRRSGYIRADLRMTGVVDPLTVLRLAKYCAFRL